MLVTPFPHPIPLDQNCEKTEKSNTCRGKELQFKIKMINLREVDQLIKDNKNLLQKTCAHYTHTQKDTTQMYINSPKVVQTHTSIPSHNRMNHFYIQQHGLSQCWLKESRHQEYTLHDSINFTNWKYRSVRKEVRTRVTRGREDRCWRGEDSKEPTKILEMSWIFGLIITITWVHT